MSKKVTFLFDSSNNWMEEYLNKEHKIFSMSDFDFEIVKDHNLARGRDIVFILGYTRILDNDFLKSNGINLVVHESDLPKGKGFAPVQWQILEGKIKIPICLIEATKSVDAGDIILKNYFNISKTDLYDDIRSKQAEASFEIIFSFLNKYPIFERSAQVGGESTYRKRTGQDNELNIDKSIREQFDILRIGNNEGWPSYFFINDKKFIIKIYRE